MSVTKRRQKKERVTALQREIMKYEKKYRRPHPSRITPEFAVRAAVMYVANSISAILNEREAEE